VKTLECLGKGVLVDSKKVFLHTTDLFKRLIVLVERTSDMEPCFSYELTPQPAALFKSSAMRKPDKSSLGRHLTKDATVTGYQAKPVHVLDGGCLLHKVRWAGNSTYGEIMHVYVKYVAGTYGKNATVVFDGYGNSSTKDHEHERHLVTTAKTCTDVVVAENVLVRCKQNEFLANGLNKMNFITLLSKHLTAEGIAVRQAKDDADTEIVKAALELASQQQVTAVVADDTDVLVLLTHHLKLIWQTYLC
jgi:hypothetical protein